MLLRVIVTSLALFLGLLDTAGQLRAAHLQGGRQRIVAVGDVHGSFSGLTGILQAAGIVDARHRWSGGRARLVQVGDFLDRGQDVRAVMDLLMRLEGEARRAGGQVDVVFGNHEGMNLLHDLRDVSPQAYSAFADKRSEDRRRRAYDAHAALARRTGGTLDRDAWMAAHPPGFVEYTEAISPGGRYGRWLRTRKAIVRIDETLFMHAGLRPEDTASIEVVNRGVEREVRIWDDLVSTLERQRLITRTFGFREIVATVQDEISRIGTALKSEQPLGDHVTREFVEKLQQLVTLDQWALVASEGPLWYRGLATLPEDQQPAVEAMVRRHGVERIVIGHTPQLPGRITPRFGGRVIVIDTGMLTSYYKSGQPSALEIHEGRLTAIYPGSQSPITE